MQTKHLTDYDLFRYLNHDLKDKDKIVHLWTCKKCRPDFLSLYLECKGIEIKDNDLIDKCFLDAIKSKMKDKK
jgi:hypothetical protein